MDSSFYQNLWKLLDKQRGSMDLHKFKEICFDLIFLLAVNRQFEQERMRLPARDQEDSDSYDLWLEKESRWGSILEDCHRNSLNQTIYRALESIEQSSEKYRNLTHKGTFLSENLDFQKLTSIVHDFDNNFAKFPPSSQIDYLGNAYQFFLQQFAASSGRVGGEFYTPACVVQLLVSILQPFPSPNQEIIIYDPCCGSGGMFIQSKEFIQRNKKSNGNNVYPPLCLGQEIDDSTWKLARMNLLLHGLNPRLGSKAADTFKEDLHGDWKVDYVITNPPFNISDYYLQENDPRWEYGVPPKNDANFAWIEHCLFKLKEKGVATIIMANGTLSGLNKKAVTIRQNLIENNLVEAIITLPNNLFYSTGIAPCVWVLRKNRENEQTLMIDVSQDDFGKKISGSERIIEEEDIEKISQLYQEFRQQGQIKENIAISARVVSLAEIKENNYILVPARYLFTQKVKLSPEEIDNQLLKNTEELEKMIAEQDKYHQELKKLLAEVKKEIENKKE